MHKHNPCADKSVINRSFTFLFSLSSQVDRESQTGICADCGKLIDAPSLKVYELLSPVLFGLCCGVTCILCKRFLNWSIASTLVVIVYGLLFWRIIPSQILAFDKWKEAPVENMTNAEYMQHKTAKIKEYKRSKGFIIKMIVSGVVGLLLDFVLSFIAG